MLLHSKKETLDDNEDYPQEEYDDGDLVDPMHHPDIDVGRSRRVMLSKEVAPHLSKRKEMPDVERFPLLTSA